MRWLVDLLYPRRCVSCNQRGEWLCRVCRDAFPKLPDQRCRFCATPLRSVAVCPACWKESPAFDSLTCGFLFAGPVRSAVHHLKYRNARHLAGPLVDALLATATLPSDVDAIIPVPLYPTRLRQRGYNQSGLLAAALAERTGLMVSPDLLVRVRDTPTQTTLPAADRWRNVRGAFRAGAPVRDTRLLLVDDVATTTGTLRAAAAELKDAGAAQVHAVVLARVP